MAKIMVWIGWMISAVPILAMGIGSAVFLVLKHDEAVQGFTKYGFAGKYAVPILLLEIGCAVLYAIPRTAVLGAILLTGYLGGAVATHVRADELPNVIGPVLAGVFVWLGLYLRDPRLRKLVPFR